MWVSSLCVRKLVSLNTGSISLRALRNERSNPFGFEELGRRGLGSLEAVVLHLLITLRGTQIDGKILVPVVSAGGI